MAAYVWLASRSQAKISKQRIFRQVPSSVHSGTCAALAGFRLGSSLDSCRATSSKRPLLFLGGDGGRVPGHWYSMPYMKIPAINQVIFIKHVLARYRFCQPFKRSWRKLFFIRCMLISLKTNCYIQSIRFQKSLFYRISFHRTWRQNLKTLRFR